MKIVKKFARSFNAHSKMGAAIRIIWKLEKGVGSSEQIEQAIALLYEARLEFDEINNQSGYAAASLNLAKVFSFRTDGGREENLNRKIALLEESLARALENKNESLQLSLYEKLGETYYQLFSINKLPDLIDRTIEYLEKILKIASSSNERAIWIEATIKFVALSFERVQHKTDHKSAEQNIRLLEDLLPELFFWERWKFSGRIHYLLGETYFRLLEGNVGENLESAIFHLHKALDSRFFNDAPGVRADIYTLLAKCQSNRARGGIYGKRHAMESFIALAHKLYASVGDDEKIAQLEDIRIEALRDKLTLIRPELTSDEIQRMITAKKQSNEITPYSTEIEKYKNEVAILEMESLYYSTKILEKMFEVMESAPVDKSSQYFSEIIDFNFKSVNREIKADHPHLFEEAEKKCIELKHLVQSSLKLLDKRENPLEWATANLSLAGVYIFKSRFLDDENAGEDFQQKSFVHFKEALSVFLGLGNTQLLGFLSRISGLPILFINKHWNEAEELFRTTLEAQEQAYRISLSEKGKENVLREIGDPLFGMASVQAYTLARLGKKIEAVETLEKWRGRKIGELLQRDARNLKAADAGIFREYCEVVDKINVLEARQRNHSGWELAAIFTDLRSSRQRLDEIIKQIRSTHPDFMIEPSFSEIRQAASENKPLAYILTTEVGSLILLVFDKGEPVALWEDSFTKGNLFSALAGMNFENSMEESIIKNPERLNSAILPKCAKLPEKLIDELKVRKAEAVVLIPCGTLALLPIHAISVEDKGCLLDDFDIHYAPSAYTMLLANRSLSEGSKFSPSFLGIGDPDRSLVNAELEVRAINSLFTGLGKSDYLIHEEATLKNLQDNIRNVSHLHFACHGEFGIINSLESSLLLAQNEKLTLQRILEDHHFKFLKDSRLVILSACQTSLVEVSATPDESFGITLGFLSAGVPGVIGTLWSVPDISTALLMIIFYREHILNNFKPASALRMAQCWLRDATSEQIERVFSDFQELPNTFRLKTREADFPSEKFTQEDDRPFADPYYWAGFILVGT